MPGCGDLVLRFVFAELQLGTFFKRPPPRTGTAVVHTDDNIALLRQELMPGAGVAVVLVFQWYSMEWNPISDELGLHQ